MNNLKKVKAVRDDSGHWYIIPNELLKEFRRLEELITNDDNKALDEFIEKFDQYRTGGSLNNIQLWAEIN